MEHLSPGHDAVVEAVVPLVDDLGDLLDLGRLVLLIGRDQVLGHVVQLVDVDPVLVDLGVEGLEK